MVTVGMLHVTGGCAASFTQFAPFSCYRPESESVLSAPAAVSCSCLDLDRYGSWQVRPDQSRPARYLPRPTFLVSV